MKRIISMMAIAAVVATVPMVFAEDEGAAVEAKAKPELKELTLSGKVTAKESKNKAGESKAYYILTTTDGVAVKLPVPKAKEGAEAINLASFVNADVEVVAKGMEMEKAGKKRITIKEIVSINKAEGAAEAPAAEAEAEAVEVPAGE